MASIEEGPQQGQAFCDTLTRQQYNIARAAERERLGLPAEASDQPVAWWCHQENEPAAS